MSRPQLTSLSSKTHLHRELVALEAPLGRPRLDQLGYDIKELCCFHFACAGPVVKGGRMDAERVCPFCVGLLLEPITG